MSAVPCLVSVITPVFNSARTLRRAAMSALDQSLREIELLIVDDGSSDGSRAVAEELARDDPRVHVIALPCNRGKPHAMNTAMGRRAGLGSLFWTPMTSTITTASRELVTAGEATGVDLVADNQLLYDAGAGRVVGPALSETEGTRPLTRELFARGCDPYAGFDLGMLKPVVRAAFVREAGLRYRENAKLSEDFLFLAEFLASGGRALIVSRPLYVWTQAFGSLSRRWTETGGGAWRYDFRLCRAGAHRRWTRIRGPRRGRAGAIAGATGARVPPPDVAQRGKSPARVRAGGCRDGNSGAPSKRVAGAEPSRAAHAARPWRQARPGHAPFQRCGDRRARPGDEWGAGGARLNIAIRKLP